MEFSNQKSCEEQLQKLSVELQLEQEHAQQLERLLNHDPDTGLPQRHVLIRRLIQMVRDGEEAPFAYGIIRLDRRYQRIKYTRDRIKVLLYITAERIKSILGEGNVYQSDRSDEFLFVMKGFTSDQNITERIEEVQSAILEKHNAPASDLSFGSNVGVAVYPWHARKLEELEVNAEIALGIYERKREQGFLYTPELGERFHENESLVHQMHQSIQDEFNGFYVVYQPIIDTDRKVMGCEALMRWTVSGFGAIPPARFIPLAEENGYIRFLGKWVLYQALNQIRLWRESHGTDFFMSVNLSTVQLESSEILSDIETALNTLDLPGDVLHLEITESAVMENPMEITAKLRKIRDMGVKIMVDDFGTGYSNLNYLHQFPVDTLKIAKEFLDTYPQDEGARELVRAIQGLAQSFGFATLAEGIEKQEQFDALKDSGVHFIQGYIFSPPIDPAEFEEKYLM